MTSENSPALSSLEAERLGGRPDTELISRIDLILAKPTCRVEEAAVVLAIGRNTVFTGIANGQIPSIRIGRRVLIPTAALRRMIQLDEPAGDVR